MRLASGSMPHQQLHMFVSASSSDKICEVAVEYVGATDDPVQRATCAAVHRGARRMHAQGLRLCDGHPKPGDTPPPAASQPTICSDQRNSTTQEQPAAVP